MKHAKVIERRKEESRSDDGELRVDELISKGRQRRSRARIWKFLLRSLQYGV